MIRDGQAPRPRFSTTTQKKLAESKGATALLSYTETGFEPREIAIKQGEAVRFTNNSNADVWIAAGGGTVAIDPRTEDGCGTSDLDSCVPFPAQDFWEFTFDITGEWHVVNNLDKSKEAIVHVQ